jgi:4-carboxymuconolactone decarboxylase
MTPADHPSPDPGPGGPTDGKTAAALSHAAAMAGSRWQSPEEAFAAGLAIRQAMFGDGGAEDQVLGADAFTFPMQDYVTRWCFGETWTREALPLDVRSMLTMAMLLATGRPNEFRVHVGGALANGVTPDQIQEVILHAMIYCGVPKAVEGFRIADEVLRAHSTAASAASNGATDAASVPAKSGS